MSTNPSLIKQAKTLTLLLIVLAGIPALLIGAWLINQSSSKAVEGSLKERTPLVVQLIENDIASKMQALQNASRLLQVQRVEDITQAQLDSIVQDFSGVVWAGVAGVDGKVHLAHKGMLQGANVSKRPWFVGGLQKPSVMDKHDAVLLAKLLPQRDNPYQFIDIAVPISDAQGKPLGVLALHLDWAWYQNQFPSILGQVGQPQHLEYLVYGRDGVVRLSNVSNQLASVWNDQIPEKELASVLEDDFFWTSNTGLEGGSLRSLGWTLYALEPKSTSQQAVLGATFFGLLMFMLGLVAAGMAYLRLSRKVSAVGVQFVEALVQRDEAKLGDLKSQLPKEMLPLSVKAEKRFTALREEQEALHVALVDARLGYLKIQQLIAQAPVAIAMFDSHMNYLACSDLWRKAYFPNVEDATGQSHYSLIPNIPEQWKVAHQQGLAGQVIRADNDHYTTATGKEVWLNWTIQPWLREDGLVGGIIIITEDVTEANLTRSQLEQSETRFKLAMEGSHDGLWDWDLENNHIYFSPSWYTMLGYAPNAMPANFETWENLLHPNDVEIAKSTVFSALQSSLQAKFTGSFRLRHNDGHYVRILSRGIIVRDNTGKPLRMVGTHLDRTEVESLQSELQDAWLMAQAEARSNDAKSKFLATVSHEIRNPLNSVCGFARLIRDEAEEPELKRYAQLLSQTTDSLTLVLNDLLDFAKIDAGKLEIVKEPFSINTLTNELAASANLLCREKGVEFEFIRRLDPDAFYMGDIGRIRQVLQNLLSNAIKFTESGVVKLRVVVNARPAADTEEVTFTVEDSGVGIASDKLDKLFKPFSQAHVDSANRYGGTGLGLTIVKSLTELMDGEVHCESILGVGSKFKVQLPLQRCHAPEGAQTADVLVIKPKRILIADDAAINLKVLDAFLTKRGHQVHTALHGEEALHLLQTEQFDYALLDMDMPNLSGLEVVRSCRSNATNASVAVHFACLSGHASRADVDLALGSGFERYFTKPVNLDDLLRYVNGR